MGGFTNAVVGVGSAVLPAAIDYANARAGYKEAREAYNSNAQNVMENNARQDKLYQLDQEAYAALQAEADRIVADAEAEAARRMNFLEMETNLQRAATERWNEFQISRAEREAELAQAQATAEAEAAQRRLESQQAQAAIEQQQAEAARAEAARLRAAELKKAQASARARFGASGLLGSTSANAVLTGMAQETAALDAADAAAAQAARESYAESARQTARDVSSLWQAVEMTRQKNLLELSQIRQRAALSLTDLNEAATLDLARAASDNELAIYRARNAASRMVADAWLQVRRSAIETEGRKQELTVQRPDALSYFQPVISRAITGLASRF